MELLPTLALVALWPLVALLGWLIFLLMRQHGQVLLDQERLADRLASLERALAQPADRAAGSAGADARVWYRPLTLKNGVRLEIGHDLQLSDPIRLAVASEDPWFLDDYYALLDRMRPGDFVLDVGSHIGTFALPAAALGCRVVCVEAAPENVALLRASVARNGFDQVVVVAAAATDHEGTLEFLPNGPWGTVSNSLTVRTPGLIYARQHAPVTVRALTVDRLLRDLGWERVDFLKMDIEGSELAAIRGMSRLLARPDGPLLLYESNGHMLRLFGGTPEQLTTALHDFGYSSYYLEPERLVPIQLGELQPTCVVNCLAVKGELPRLADWPIAAPRSREKWIGMVVEESRHLDPHHRAYTGRMLAQAEPGLVADSRLADALRSLGDDPDDDVRVAAAWFRVRVAG